MDADHKSAFVEVRPMECATQQDKGKEEPVMEKENTMRSIALRNDQISENDVLILAMKAKEMIEEGSTPPTPKNRVRDGKRSKVKN